MPGCIQGNDSANPISASCDGNSDNWGTALHGVYSLKVTSDRKVAVVSRNWAGAGDGQIEYTTVNVSKLRETKTLKQSLIKGS